MALKKYTANTLYSLFNNMDLSCSFLYLNGIEEGYN